MPLSLEHVESKIVAKIKIYILTRAELLFNLCYEIPCIFFLYSCRMSKRQKKLSCRFLYFVVFLEQEKQPYWNMFWKPNMLRKTSNVLLLSTIWQLWTLTRVLLTNLPWSRVTRQGFIYCKKSETMPISKFKNFAKAE